MLSIPAELAQRRPGQRCDGSSRLGTEIFVFFLELLAGFLGHRSCWVPNLGLGWGTCKACKAATILVVQNSSACQMGWHFTGLGCHDDCREALGLMPCLPNLDVIWRGTALRPFQVHPPVWAAGTPGDAGPAAGDHKEARERYRNALFDREAGGGSGALGVF